MLELTSLTPDERRLVTRAAFTIYEVAIAEAVKVSGQIVSGKQLTTLAAAILAAACTAAHDAEQQGYSRQSGAEN